MDTIRVSFDLWDMPCDSDEEDREFYVKLAGCDKTDKVLKAVLKAERDAFKQISKMLAPFGEVIWGAHSDGDVLDCWLYVETSKLADLHAFIQREHGGGDDAIFLDYGRCYVAQSFVLIPEPGISEAISFDRWEDYIENLQANS